ncbi:MAG TPA: D-alanyl-D-alanine carboxypeptidase [Reyranella sp.]
MPILPAAKPLPAAISDIMAKPRYAAAKSKWSLVVLDAQTGAPVYMQDPDRLSLTGSVRKMFSVAAALQAVGVDHRFETPVYATGPVANGVLSGDLVLVASGDLTLGGRTRPDGTLDYTAFDHNEAPAFGSAQLTPEDPLAGIDELARQVRAAGIERVTGDVVIDGRLFESFRVPNGNVLISPMSLNENLIDVTLAPGAQAGAAGVLDWRPRISGFSMNGQLVTGAAGSAADMDVFAGSPGDIALGCLGTAGCGGTVAGADGHAPASIPQDFEAPLIGGSTRVAVLRVEDPASFAHIAFLDALNRAGVAVSASVVSLNPASKLPPASSFSTTSRVANFVSPAYAEYARLILKVSLNTGANMSLMQVGVSQGQRTVGTALAAERRLLTGEFGLDPAGFDFPTNGSGTPDSRASARTTAQLIGAMSRRPFYQAYRQALPLLGVDGSLATVGKDVVGKEHISAKSGATVADGQMVAISLAGYIDGKSGRRLAFALFVNDAGPLAAISDSLDVFEDEARIAGIVYGEN